jgi:hypothetical protein
MYLGVGGGNPVLSWEPDPAPVCTPCAHAPPPPPPFVLAQVVAFKQQTNIMNEKNVMMMVDHPFVLKLETTFKDANSLYMLLEFVQGGELFTLLANQDTGRLTIPHAKSVWGVGQGGGVMVGAAAALRGSCCATGGRGGDAGPSVVWEWTRKHPVVVCAPFECVWSVCFPVSSGTTLPVWCPLLSTSTLTTFCTETSSLRTC